MTLEEYQIQQMLMKRDGASQSSIGYKKDPNDGMTGNGFTPKMSAFYSDAFKGMPQLSLGGQYRGGNFSGGLGVNSMNPTRKEFSDPNEIGLKANAAYDAGNGLSFFAKGGYSPGVDFLNSGKYQSLGKNDVPLGYDINQMSQREVPYQLNELKGKIGMNYNF